MPRVATRFAGGAGVAALLAGVGLTLYACAPPPHRDGVVVQSGGDCVSCHLQNYNATTLPQHAAVGISTTCADCHGTTTWDITAHYPSTEPLFPVGSGVHAGVACMDCHNTAISTDFRTNSDCTGSCHTAANTEGFNSTAVPEVVGIHNGAKFDSTNRTFCRSCHPTGEGATAAAKVHASTNPFPSSHHGSSCSECHNVALSPPAQEVGQQDYSQDVDCTSGGCHPQSQTSGFHPTTTVAATMDGASLPQAILDVASTSGFQATGSVYVATTPTNGSITGIQKITYTALSATSFTGCTGGTTVLHTGDAIIRGHNGATAWGYQKNGPPVATDHQFCAQKSCHPDGGT